MTMFQRIENTCRRHSSAAAVESVLRSLAWRYRFMSTTMPRRMSGMRPPTIICTVM